MITQKFKGDVVELKFDAAGAPALDQVSTALDQFWASEGSASPFILMLFDEKRVPFYDRVKRIAFVEFYKEVLKRFPTIGTFDCYLFVLSAIFGDVTDISFDVPGPGILYVDVNSASNLEFDFIGREVDGSIFDITDDQGNTIAFRGISGIETGAELELLFSEIMPAGISPHVSLSFFSKYTFVAEDAVGGFDDVVDHLGNNIIFTEVGI